MHAEETLKELRADREYAVAHLKPALEELDEPRKIIGVELKDN